MHMNQEHKWTSWKIEYLIQNNTFENARTTVKTIRTMQKDRFAILKCKKSIDYFRLMVISLIHDLRYYFDHKKWRQLK